MDQEPHHHLVMQNDIVKVFEIDLAPRDALSMHRHDYDEVSIALGDATTVSTTPGKPDILTISKPGDAGFALGGWEHSVRNIGQTAFHSISIASLRAQSGARNFCGTQIPDLPANCPATKVDANAPRVDLPQFETDQMRVTFTRIRPRQQANLGESDRDELIVMIDEAAITGTSGKGVRHDQKLAAGSVFWIARGGAGRVLKNNSDKEVRVVTVSFKP
jgi:quercetin dioxygenase-like cupin family protein